MPKDKPDIYALARHRMVQEQLRCRGIADPRVLEVMDTLPREPFVAEEYRYAVYEDHLLPIGEGQSISQPYIVALMVDALRVTPNCRVLDVGVGSGYQTAILAHLAKKVYGIERIEPLLEQARLTLAGLGIANIELTVGDGSLGWPEHAPYDRIICGASAPQPPASWIEQLAEGGRIVAPTADRGEMLMAYDKRNGKIIAQPLCPVRFVPLIGRQGWPE